MSSRISTRRSTVLSSFPAAPTLMLSANNSQKRKRTLTINTTTAALQQDKLQENSLENVNENTSATSKCRSSARLALKDVSNQPKQLEVQHTPTNAQAAHSVTAAAEEVDNSQQMDGKKNTSKRKRKNDGTTIEKEGFMKETAAGQENASPVLRAKGSVEEVLLRCSSSAVDSSSFSPARGVRVIKNPLSEKQPKKSILKKSTANQSATKPAATPATPVSMDASAGILQYTDAALKNIFSVEKAVTFQFHGKISCASAPASPASNSTYSTTAVAAVNDSAPSLCLSSTAAVSGPSPLRLPSPAVHRRVSRTLADVLHSASDCEEKSRLLKNLEELQRVGISGLLQTSMRKILEDSSPFNSQKNNNNMSQHNKQKENICTKLNFEEYEEDEQKQYSNLAGICENDKTHTASQPTSPHHPASSPSPSVALVATTSSQTLSATKHQNENAASMKRIVRYWLLAFVMIGFVVLALNVNEEVFVQRLQSTFNTWTQYR